MLRLLVVVLVLCTAHALAGGCLRIDQSGGRVQVNLLSRVPTSFTMELVLKLLRRPRDGDELFRVGSSASGFVSLTVRNDSVGEPSWAFKHGARSSLTRSTTYLPSPFEWLFVALTYNANSKIIESFINDESVPTVANALPSNGSVVCLFFDRVLADPITISADPALVVDTLRIGDTPMLVDYVRFSVGRSQSILRLFRESEFKPQPVPVYEPLLSFDVPSPILANSQISLEQVATGAVSIVPNCGARENYALKVPNNAITVDGEANECGWREAPVDQYALFFYADVVTKLRLLYDDNNLYVFAELADTTPSINNTKARDFRSDSMEIFFAASRLVPNATYRYLIVQDAASADPQMPSVAKRLAAGWQVEVRIPFTMTTRTASSKSIAALFASNDHSTIDGFTGQADNCGARYAGNFFRNAPLYSSLQLQDGLACATTTAATLTLPGATTPAINGPTPAAFPTTTTAAATTTTVTAAIAATTTTPTAAAAGPTSTFFSSPNESDLPLSMPIIIAIAVGGCCLLLILVGICVWCALRRKRAREDAAADDNAVMMHPSSTVGYGNPYATPATKGNVYDRVEDDDDGKPAIRYDSSMPTNTQIIAARQSGAGGTNYTTKLSSQQIVYEPLH
jgi:hypothetical protein